MGGTLLSALVKSFTETYELETLHDFDRIWEEIHEYMMSLCKDNQLMLFSLVVLEAIENTMKHGELPATITISTHFNEVIITVEDCGSGFDIQSTLKTINEKGVDTLLEEKARNYETSGRGILMMLSQSDQVVFHPSGTKVSLYKKF